VPLEGEQIHRNITHSMLVFCSSTYVATCHSGYIVWGGAWPYRAHHLRHTGSAVGGGVPSWGGGAKP
jgi:hypothetical protein